MRLIEEELQDMAEKDDYNGGDVTVVRNDRQRGRGDSNAAVLYCGESRS